MRFMREFNVPGNKLLEAPVGFLKWSPCGNNAVNLRRHGSQSQGGQDYPAGALGLRVVR